MEKLLIVSALLGIGAFGFLKIGMKIKNQNERLEFAIEFLGKLKSYVNSRGRNIEEYGWMVHRSNKMQNHLGRLGILQGYKPPYQNYIVKNYPIILNMLPDLRTSIEDEIMGNLASQYASSLQEALVRHVGCVEDYLSFFEKDLKNPVKWFREGIREIIAVPAYLLGWLGIISESLAHRIISSTFFKALAGIMGLFGFISALVTIVIGWDEFTKKMTAFLTNHL